MELGHEQPFSAKVAEDLQVDSHVVLAYDVLADCFTGPVHSVCTHCVGSLHVYVDGNLVVVRASVYVLNASTVLHHVLDRIVSDVFESLQVCQNTVDALQWVQLFVDNDLADHQIGEHFCSETAES